MTRKTASTWTAALLGLVVAACGDDGSTSASGGFGQPTSASAGSATQATDDGSGGTTEGTSQGSDPTAAPTTSTTTSGSTTDATSVSSDSAPKLDVGAEETGFETDSGVSDEGCVAVDLLFVIDNSVSMGAYQNALSLAFPAFADAIVDSLPPGTNLHVGVTSTTMGKSNIGSTTNCKATGANMQPQEAFYETPDLGNNGMNGAQGRLYQPANGPTFFTIDTDAGPAEIDALKSWFAQAAKIGEGGSQIEMATAAAGWVADPANAATNAGFVRDAGAVLALFFLQDEPDQTPWTIDGQPGGLVMLDKLAAAKSECGGAQCIIGGGFVNTQCLGQVPLGDLLGNLGAPAVVDQLPAKALAENSPELAAQQMSQLLSETLANVIAQKCDEIAPPK